MTNGLLPWVRNSLKTLVWYHSRLVGSDVSHAWWFPNQFFPTDLHGLFYWQSKLGLQDTPIPPHQAAQTPLTLKLSDTK